MIEGIQRMFAENPQLTALVGISGMGVATYMMGFAKDILNSLYGLLMKHSSISYVFDTENNELMVHVFVDYLHSTGDISKFKTVINHRDFGQMPYNTSRLLFHQGRFLWVHVYSDDKSVGSVDSSLSGGVFHKNKITFSITTPGLSNHWVMKWMLELRRDWEEKTYLCDGVTIHSFKDDDHHTVTTISKKRGFESYYMDVGTRHKLVSAIDRFYNDRDIYVRNGLPYKLNILLYGPPGTGKSSLVKVLASQYDAHVSICRIKDTGKISDPTDDMYIGRYIRPFEYSNDPEKEAKKNTEDVGPRMMSVVEDFDHFLYQDGQIRKDINLSHLLNAMDGLSTPEGLIRFYTTNHLDIVDPSLIRPGRIDLMIELGYATRELLMHFLKSNFPNEYDEEHFNNLELHEKTVMSAVAVDILSLSYSEYLSKYFYLVV